MSKFSRWFGPDVKPVHVGVYRTQFSADPLQYSYWDGKCWALSASTPKQAAKFAADRVGQKQSQEKRWRGLAQPSTIGATVNEEPVVSLVAYKAFNADLTCRGFQYAIGATYEQKTKASLCHAGFHACTIPFDCWGYYGQSLTFARVRMERVSDERENDSKVASAKITIEASLSLPEWIKTQVETVVRLCKSAAAAMTDKDNAPAATTGYGANAATTGESANAATTGYGANAATTGESANAATTGVRANAATTGVRANAATTGYGANAATTGVRANAATTGVRANAATTGYGANAATTGESANAATTGESANAATTGVRANAATTGVRANAATTGVRANAATTGYGANAATTGVRANAETKGKNTVASATGLYGCVKAGENGCLVAGWWDTKAERPRVTVGYVGENGIQANTWYRANDRGDLVPA